MLTLNFCLNCIGGLGADVVITEEDDIDDLEEVSDLDDEDSDELSNMLDKCNIANMKKEVKQEQAMDPLAVKLQEGLRIKQEASLRIKQEHDSQASAWRDVKVEPPAADPSSSWPIKREPTSPVLAGALSAGSVTNMEMILTKLNDMTHMIQTQRSEMQVLKEEMRYLHREDLDKFRSLLDESNRSS